MKIKTENDVVSVKCEPYIPKSEFVPTKKIDKKQRLASLQYIKNKEDEESRQREQQRLKKNEDEQREFDEYFNTTVVARFEPLIAEKYNVGYTGGIILPFNDFIQDNGIFTYDRYNAAFYKWINKEIDGNAKEYDVKYETLFNLKKSSNNLHVTGKIIKNIIIKFK